MNIKRKYIIGFIITIILVFVVVSCDDDDLISINGGSVSFVINDIGFNAMSTKNGRLEDITQWEHIFKDVATLNVINKVNGRLHTKVYNPNDITTMTVTDLPYGTYTFESFVDGGVFENYLPYSFSGEFIISGPSLIISVDVVTDYSLITLDDENVGNGTVQIGNNTPVPMQYLIGVGYYYKYVKSGNSVDLIITEVVDNIVLKRTFVVDPRVHYNFILRIFRGEITSMQLLLVPFIFLEEIIPITFYELKEGDVITIIAEANPGFIFSHWTLGELRINEGPTWEFTMPGDDVNIVAYFVKE